MLGPNAHWEQGLVSIDAQLEDGAQQGLIPVGSRDG